MQDDTPVSPLTEAEAERLRSALAERYRNTTNVLGSQLGSFVRSHLGDPDLKARFGGLRQFLARHFPSQIVWSGRRGLDDLYDTCFDEALSTQGFGSWKPSSLEPSPTLWAAVSDPAIRVDFALSTADRALLQAPAGFALSEHLVAVKKLSATDYQEISEKFVDSLIEFDNESRAEASACLQTTKEFTEFTRRQGLLAQWETFRVEEAIRTFVTRLEDAGAEPEASLRLANTLRSSHQLVHERRAASRGSSMHRPQRFIRQTYVRDGGVNSRAVASKAIEFLADSELETLRLPLGAVMRAVGALLRRA